MMTMKKLLPLVLVLVAACGATQEQIDGVLKASKTQATIYAADSTSAVSLVEFLIAHGQIDTSTDAGKSLMGKLLKMRDQLRDNQTNYRIVGLKLQELVMAMTSVSPAERATYVSDLSAILGSLTNE